MRTITDLDELLCNCNILQENITSYINTVKITYNKLIKELFKYIKENCHNKQKKSLVLNAVNLISFLCISNQFNEEEILINKDRIKKTRNLFLEILIEKEDSIIRKACNKLDEIALVQSISDKDLIIIIKHMIDIHEDISVIKKLLDINRACILLKDDNLFEYTFRKAINALNNNDYLITYYITLLKIFYFSDIDKNKYLSIIENMEHNPLSNEIYNIIMGNKRSLSTNEIIEKYGKTEDKTPSMKTLNLIKKEPEGTIITIDGLKSTLIDDGISVIKDGPYYIVSIHISDVGKVLTKDSDIDNRALELYKNSYLKDRKIEIIPKTISSKLSLTENEIRGSISLNVVMNDSGDIIDYYITNNSIIVSNNLSYLDVNGFLDTHNGNDLTRDIEILFNLSNSLKIKSQQKEKYWESKEVSKIYKRLYNTKSHMLVGEFAILYNKLMARHALEKGIPFIYRAQDRSYLPSLLEELDIKVSNKTEDTINSVFLEGYYTSSPNYHTGLHERVYSQCSSPIRRYTDIYNQYLIHKYIIGDKDFDDSNIEDIISTLNRKEFETRLFEEEYNRSAILERKLR